MLQTRLYTLHDAREQLDVLLSFIQGGNERDYSPFKICSLDDHYISKTNASTTVRSNHPFESGVCKIQEAHSVGRELTLTADETTVFHRPRIFEAVDQEVADFCFEEIDRQLTQVLQAERCAVRLNHIGGKTAPRKHQEARVATTTAISFLAAWLRYVEALLYLKVNRDL